MTGILTASLLSLTSAICAAPLELDERPTVENEWGYRPAPGSVSATDPPGFSWRPQSGVVAWELECRPVGDAAKSTYSKTGIALNVHCPPLAFKPGEYTWRYRGVDEQGRQTNWSRWRAFTIDASASQMPMPTREELLRKVPTSHPRLFVRPEDVPRLQELARGPMKEQFTQLVAHCERLLAKPPPTGEPPKYPPDMDRKSEEWLKIWWGNRTYTTAALDGAATLAFTRLLGGKDEYGQLAKRILLDCAEWDPVGSTGYRYNDEAGMPYAYYFARTYTFVYDLLSEEERRRCRAVMKVRGDEMYRHLCPRHLWRPYASHSNRAWHFLGELGIALHGEVEGADDWLWFAMNVFFNVYPVWSDDDGGWHEGSSYWSSYVSRFTWWADVMKAATGVDAYRKPFFAKAGYYPLYLMPPGKVGGGFGDLTARKRAGDFRPLVSVLAAQSGNPHWQWYVEQSGGPVTASGYVGFIRGTLPEVAAQAPDELPTSRLFRGTGQAYLNSSLSDANDSVQVVFKSSPFGTQSHGYEANNSFLLWAYGQRLLVRTGYRDTYGSDHHSNWMWSTRSVNNITVDGHGQVPHSAASKGLITAFHSTDSIDVVVGSAGGAYRKPGSSGEDAPLLDRFTRAILFVKPELVIVFDRLNAPHEAVFEYRLHSPERFDVADQDRITLRSGDVVCPIRFLAPRDLSLSQTDQYDPNPRARIKLREWHLTASTAEKTRAVEFVTLLRPHRKGADMPTEAQLQRTKGGYVLSADLSDGRVIALLPLDESAHVSASGLSTTGAIVVQRKAADGSIVETVRVEESTVPDTD